MRMADAELLPFDFHDFADTIHMYVGEVKKLLADERTKIEENNQDLDEGVFTANADPKKPYVPPARKAVPPFLNFAPLENADATLTRSAARFNKALDASEKGDLRIDPQTMAEINGLLIQSERRLTREAGQPARPWYKHVIYAPGAYTGYGVKTLPTVREALEQDDWKTAEEQIPIVAKVIEDEAALIDTVTGLLSGTTNPATR